MVGFRERLLAAAMAPATSPVAPIATRPLEAGAVVVHLGLLAGPALHVLRERFVGLAHLRVTEVHFSVKVVGEAAVVVEAAEVGATHVADLELLVARGARRVGERLKLLFLVRLGLGHDLEVEPLVYSDGHHVLFGVDLDLVEATLDICLEVGDALEL